MYKRLYRMALITAPVFGIYGTAPFHFIHEGTFQMFLTGFSIETFVTALQWLLNIFILKKVGEDATNKPYFLSYLASILLLLASMAMLELMTEGKPEGNAIYPFMMILAINTLILVFINSELLRKRKETAELEIQELKLKNMEAQHHLLMRQFQPHFLFNALSTLKSLIKIDKREADNYLLKLSEFLRFSIAFKDQSLVLLSKELKFTKEYLGMQQIRFEDAVFCKFNISEDVMQWQIPAFALQSLVENAIKHNGFSEEKPLNILIENKGNQLIVSNNKMFKKVVDSNKTGLTSLNDRHQMLTGEPIVIKETETHFEVTLKLLEK